MEINQYQQLAMTTLNRSLSPGEMLLNSLMGLCGESGECMELMKKHRFHGKELDRDALIL